MWRMQGSTLHLVHLRGRILPKLHGIREGGCPRGLSQKGNQPMMLVCEKYARGNPAMSRCAIPSLFPAAAHRFFGFYTAFEMRIPNSLYTSTSSSCSFDFS
jgi:hypothetical protein